MKRRIFVSCILLCGLTGCQSPPRTPDLSSFLKGHKAAVMVFLASDCPLSQNYTLTLNHLHARFGEREGIAFFGILAGDRAAAEMDAFAKKYKLQFPLIEDRNFELADTFDAAVTPEAFVVRADGRTLYKGAIDDWAVELGRHRKVITRHYLNDVLTSVVAGQAPPYHETAAVGCFIERKG